MKKSQKYIIIQMKCENIKQFGKTLFQIIGFQNTNANDGQAKNVKKFITADISYIRFYLSSEVFHNERWNLDSVRILDSID